MEKPIYRETIIEIDLAAIRANIKAIQAELPDTTDVMAVVKADAYGYGAVRVAQEALRAGAASLAVALLEEALELRESGIIAPILVLGIVPPEYAEVAARHDITLTCCDVSWLKAVDDQALSKPVHVQMKWDTGMGRIGLRTEDELRNMLDVLKETKNIHLTGVFTHFATADDEDLSYVDKQRERFEQLLTLFRANWSAPVQIHLGNSAAAMRCPKDMYTTVRLGIGMYGLYPSSPVREDVSVRLTSAYRLTSKLSYVKHVPKGQSIGYGMGYVTSTDEWIGTIVLGYADGWIRQLEGFKVLINGKRHPIIGRICMDQLMVRLDKHYSVGTEVVFIGEQAGECITLEDVAEHANTIHYEIPCLLNGRIPKVYQI